MKNSKRLINEESTYPNSWKAFEILNVSMADELIDRMGIYNAILYTEDCIKSKMVKLSREGRDFFKQVLIELKDK